MLYPVAIYSDIVSALKNKLINTLLYVNSVYMNTAWERALRLYDCSQRAIVERVNVFVAYFDVLYFMEILYIMIVLNILFGSMVSFITGFCLGVFLATQIVMIYFKKRIARIIQLVFMELHIAYSFPLLIGLILGYRTYPLDYLVILFRTALNGIELLLVFLLTEERARREFIF